MCNQAVSLIAAELDASHKHGRFFLVCLDEMNLARVEHYFAQFLSVLERPPSERAELLLPASAYGGKLRGECPAKLIRYR